MASGTGWGPFVEPGWDDDVLFPNSFESPFETVVHDCQVNFGHVSSFSVLLFVFNVSGIKRLFWTLCNNVEGSAFSFIISATDILTENAHPNQQNARQEDEA